MKFLFLFFILVLIFQNVQAKTLVVSDVDDTIKMTGVLGSKMAVAFNGLFREKAFAGMSELYQALANDDTTVYYVSGSPKMIKFRVTDFLDENKFPQKQNLVLKNKISDNTFKFKVEAIRKIIKLVRPDKLILIGDDTESDSDVYTQISSENPGLVEGIYIRAVQNAAVNNQNFFSATEIAASETLKGNLQIKDLTAVASGFIKQTDHSGIYLENSYCPKEGRAFLEELKQKMSDLESIADLEETQSKIINICQ